MRNLQAGWPGSQPGHRANHSLAPGAFWGFVENNERIIKDLQRNAVPWYFWDMPYYGRWMPGCDQHYWRVGFCDIHYQPGKNWPSDRFEQWNVQPAKSKPGNHILVCPSSDTITRWVSGMLARDWVEHTIRTLKQHTDRPIQVRYKPRSGKLSGPAAAHVPFSKAACGAHAVVTCVSLAAVEAQLLGVPTFCDVSSFAAEVSNTKLSEIESPKRTCTIQWFSNLAYSQFTLEEIASGFAKEILHAKIGGV